MSSVPRPSATVTSRKRAMAFLMAALAGVVVMFSGVGLGTAAAAPAAVDSGPLCLPAVFDGDGTVNTNSCNPGPIWPAPPPPPPPATCTAPYVTAWEEAVVYTPNCGTGYQLHAEADRVEWDSYGPLKSADVTAFVRFERSSDGDRVDASTTRVECSDIHGGYDSDSETNASKTTLSYDSGAVPAGSLLRVNCLYQATRGGTTYSATISLTMYAPYP